MRKASGSLIKYAFAILALRRLVWVSESSVAILKRKDNRQLWEDIDPTIINVPELTKDANWNNFVFIVLSLQPFLYYVYVKQKI